MGNFLKLIVIFQWNDHENVTAKQHGQEKYLRKGTLKTKIFYSKNIRKP
jgi:hypothetical protein